MSLYTLGNLDNYKSEYNYTTTEVFKCYTGIITNFLIQCTDNIYMQNMEYYKYVVCKGVETITHVFKILMLYTKNLTLCSHYCTQSIFYYIEFIGQIGDDHHSFLQLNSKDATLFVYKKSIFEIDSAFRKEFASSNLSQEFMTTVDILLRIYSIYFIDSVNKCKLEQGKNIDLLTTIDSQCSKFSQILLNLSLDIEEDIYYKKLEIMEQFINKIIIQSLDNSVILLDSFGKKLRKNIISKVCLNNKLAVENKITEISPIKYVNWIFT